MKWKKVQLVYLLAICVVSYFAFSSNSVGITGKSVTGCGDPGCHTPAAGATTITLTGLPAPGYVAGTPYTMTLTVTNINKSAGGFDLTCSAGSIAVLDLGTTLNGAMELRHNAPKTMGGSGSVSWTFTWTAPPVSNVTFSVAGNAVDGNFQQTNDAFATAVFNFQSAAAATAPTISAVTANGISTTGATINANVNANNDNASTTVQYGLTNSYGQTIAAVPAVVTGNTPVPVSATIGGLTPGTLYHYRVVAANAIGTTNDIDRVFTTLPSSVSSIEKSGIQIYPNPARDYIYYLHKSNAAAASFKVVAMNGALQSVPTEKITDGHYKLNTATLSAGNYVLFIEVDGKQYHHSFAK